jgi:hypothetical protein
MLHVMAVHREYVGLTEIPTSQLVSLQWRGHSAPLLVVQLQSYKLRILIRKMPPLNSQFSSAINAHVLTTFAEAIPGTRAFLVFDDWMFENMICIATIRPS